MPLAPTAEIIRYMAIFERTFTAMARYGLEGNRDGMYLGGWMTNALHNAPGLLRSYRTEGTPWLTAEGMNQWMQIFPQQMRERGLPSALADECEQIFGGAVDLQAQQEPEGCAIAPTEKFRAYMSVLSEACLGMRGLRGWSGSSDVWQESVAEWNSKGDRWGRFCGRLAAALLPITTGMVQWSQFDEARFFEVAFQMASDLPEDLQKQWTDLFNRWQAEITKGA